jgi:hypothetical protein
LRNDPRLRRDQVPEAVGCIVSADTILITIHFQNILRPIRIMLQRRQRLD